MAITFGTGALFGVDSTGASWEFGTLQGVSVGFGWDAKELTGQYQFAKKVARGKAKIDCKATYGEFRAAAFNLIFGGTITAGARRKVVRETLVVTAGAATASASAGTITADLGAYDATNSTLSIPLTPTAITPVTGTYKLIIATGVYAFFTGVTSAYVSYEMSLLTGKTITLGNALMGTAPNFQIYLGNESNGSGMEIKLNSCVASKLDLGFKNDDFLIPNFEFQAMVDATNNPGFIYLDE